MRKAKPVPRRSGAKRAGGPGRPLANARPPVVVEAVHHRARRAACGRGRARAGTARGTARTRARARFAASTSSTRPGLRRSGAEAGGEGGEHAPHPTTVCISRNVLQPEQEARRPLRRRRAAPGPSARDPLVVDGSTSIAILRRGSTTARTTFARRYSKRFQRSRPSHRSVTRPAVLELDAQLDRQPHLAVAHDRHARVGSGVVLAVLASGVACGRSTSLPSASSNHPAGARAGSFFTSTA